MESKKYEISTFHERMNLQFLISVKSWKGFRFRTGNLTIEVNESFKTARHQFQNESVITA